MVSIVKEGYINDLKFNLKQRFKQQPKIPIKSTSLNHELNTEIIGIHKYHQTLWVFSYWIGDLWILDLNRPGIIITEFN